MTSFNCFYVRAVIYIYLNPKVGTLLISVKIYLAYKDVTTISKQAIYLLFSIGAVKARISHLIKVDSMIYVSLRIY